MRLRHRSPGNGVSSRLILLRESIMEIKGFTYMKRHFGSGFRSAVRNGDGGPTFPPK